jgi:hypothetical protein
MRPITKVIAAAYDKAIQRGFTKIYYLVDLHGVIMRSSYEPGVHEFVPGPGVATLKRISEVEESCIIIWSCLHDADKPGILHAFEKEGIKIAAINENPFEQSNTVSSFHEKPYFSVLFDDKAGFDPDVDWADIALNFDKIRKPLE